MRLTMRSRFSTSLPILTCVGMEYLCLGGFPHRAAFYASLVNLTLENAFHENAGSVHRVGIEFARLHQVLDFGNGGLRGGSHHGIEIACRLAIDEIAPAIALPGFYQSEISFERVL